MKGNSCFRKLIIIGISVALAVSTAPVWAFAEEDIPDFATEGTAEPEVEQGMEPAADPEQESPEVPEPEIIPESESDESGTTIDEPVATMKAQADDEGEEPEVEIKDFGAPTGSLLENVSKYRKSMRIYGIYLHRANGSRLSSDRYGDAVLIESNGKYLLMDTGAIKPRKNSSTVYHSSLVDTLKMIGVKELDVYISHLHDDHTGGLQDICDNFKVNRLYLPDLELCKYYKTPTGLSIESRYAHNLDIAEGKINELVFLKPAFRAHKDIEYKDTIYGPNARQTDRFNVGAAVFTIIGPIGTYTVDQFKSQHNNCGTKNGHCLNNCSLTAMVQCGNFRFLTAGDTEKQEEAKQVARYGNSLNCDMLKVSHHGLSTSSKTNYLKKTTPIWSFEENHGYTSSISAQVKRLRNYGYNYPVSSHRGTLIVNVSNNNVTLVKDMNNNGRIDEKAMSGWVSVKGSKKRYQYYNPSGVIRKGWMWKKGALYYLDPQKGFRYTGKHKIKGKKVEFDKNGKLISHKKPTRVKIQSAKALKKHKARIRWKKAKRASAYQIFRSTKKNSGYKHIRTVSKKRLSIKNKKLKRGKRYYYKVRAVRYVAGGVMYGAFSKPVKIVAR